MLTDHASGPIVGSSTPPINLAVPPARRGRPTASTKHLPAAGALLRSRRESLGLSLGQVARLSGYTAGHLCAVENGHAGVTADLVETVARSLRLDIAELLCAFRVVPEAAAERFFDVDRMRAALAGGV